MSLFTKLLKKSLKDFFAKRKKWLIGMSVGTILLIGINYLLSNYIDDKLSSEIKELVNSQSKGFYSVEFDEIAYNINDGRFFVTDFTFKVHPDHEKDLNLSEFQRKYIYSATVQRMNIDLTDFWSVYFTKKLKVKGIEIVKPSINILNLDKNKIPKKISFEAGNLYQVLSGHLKELKINDFKVEDGEVNYSTDEGPDYDNFKVKGIDFEVSNFQVNENSQRRTDKFFYTDDISLTIRDQVLLLKDSIHKVSFDEFHISTIDKLLQFKNFNLTKRPQPEGVLNEHNHYEITVPEFTFSGIDFVSAYNENVLKMDSIQIVKPNIHITKRVKNPLRDSTKNNLMDIAMIYSDYLKIDHFNLTDANLIFTDSTRHLPVKYSIDHISASMQKLEIDTGEFLHNKYGINFSGMDLLVKDYEMSLPDSMNTIMFDELSIASNSMELKLKGFNIRPKKTSTSNLMGGKLYAEIPYMVISDFDVARAINQDSFDIKEIYVEHPNFRFIPIENKLAKQKNISPNGFFGLFQGIQSFSSYFSLDRFKLLNGQLLIENTPNSMTPLAKLTSVNITLDNVLVDSLTDTDKGTFGKSMLELSAEKSEINLPEFAIRTQHLAFSSDKGRLAMQDIEIKNDSLQSDLLVSLQLSEILLSGIDPDWSNFHEKISMDSMRFSSPEISISDQTISSHAKKISVPKLPEIMIQNLVGQHANINIFDHGLPLFLASDINFDISKFTFDPASNIDLVNQFDYDRIKYFHLSDYNFYLTKQQHFIHAAGISWADSDGALQLDNISLVPIGKPNNRYKIAIPQIKISGVDLKRLLKESYYVGNEVLIDRPTIDLFLAKGRQENLTNLDLGFIPILMRNNFLGFSTQNFVMQDGSIHVHKKTETDSLIFEADNINLSVDGFLVDSTTEMIPERFLFANDVKLHGDYLTAYFQNSSDFYNINHFYISTHEQDIRLNGIYYSNNTKADFANKNKTRFTAKDIFLRNMDFHQFTQNQSLILGEVLINNADLRLTSVDSDSANAKANSKMEEYPFDTLLLKDISIDKILLNDAKITMDHAYISNKKLAVPDLWVLAEGIKYNPLAAADKSRIFYSDNMMIKAENISMGLPKSLSSVRIDAVELSSKDSSVHAKNFALIPLVSKYDYGPTKGYQATWLSIENNSLDMEKVDFLNIINANTLDANKIVVNKLDMSVFRDKRVSFPEWQRRPLPQATLRELDFKIDIDTIDLHNGYISYQEFAEKALSTGEVFFTDLDARITNITNDEAKIKIHPHTNLAARASIFGKGKVHAEFQFDMQNPDNIHTYGIKVDSFDITEFNRIMIPSASVKITSGHSNQIIMSAKANNEYSYGEMKFLYEDLKISLLNRESETPKGIGNVLGSFFANTFIIKSNNPRNFIIRKGDVFYERDEKRAIFNYWTKTFLSGMVSSIGATNNKKKIKKMQEENLKQLQKQENAKSLTHSNEQNKE